MNNDKMLAYELMGVIADAKAGKFDDVCIETLERVCAALSTPADGEEQAVAWITDSLPEVPIGGEKHCFIAVRNKKTGKVYVWDAFYCNKPVPDDAEDYDYDWVLHDRDGELIGMVGWTERMNHPDYSCYYEQISFEMSEFLGWLPVEYPTYPLCARPSPAANIQAQSGEAVAWGVFWDDSGPLRVAHGWKFPVFKEKEAAEQFAYSVRIAEDGGPVKVLPLGLLSTSPAANIQALDGWAEKAASIAMDCRSLNYEEFFTKHGTYDIRAAMEGIFATSPQQSGATFDDEAERITAELVGATGGINPDATSIDDIFDSPQSGEAYKTCDICDGAKGGVPGNGNLINGQVVCDYCHADGSYPSPAKPTDSEGKAVAWTPLKSAGQIQAGDFIRFNIGEAEFVERAAKILNSGSADEEVVYNKKRNYYFITSMALDGSSNHKNIQVLSKGGERE